MLHSPFDILLQYLSYKATKIAKVVTCKLPQKWISEKKKKYLLLNYFTSTLCKDNLKRYKCMTKMSAL